MRQHFIRRLQKSVCFEVVFSLEECHAYRATLHPSHAARALVREAIRRALRISTVVGATASAELSRACIVDIPSIPDNERVRACAAESLDGLHISNRSCQTMRKQEILASQITLDTCGQRTASHCQQVASIVQSCSQYVQFLRMQTSMGSYQNASLGCIEDEDIFSNMQTLLLSRTDM
jgi:hypothetical protein